MPALPDQTFPETKNAKIQINKPSSKFDTGWWLVIATVGLIIFLCLLKPDLYIRMVKFLSDGIWITFYTAIVTFFLIAVIGMFGGLGRISKNKFIHGAATIYVEIFRGIPMLVQLIFWYYAFPALIRNLGDKLNFEVFSSFTPDPISMAIFGLTIGYSAYMSEVYRAGIQSISKGQVEAARSLGMTYVQAMRYIILPQALRVVLPPMGNEFITLLKDTSLVSVVAVPDITRRGREFMTNNALPIETWVMVALIYLVMTLLAARLVNWIEEKTQMER